MWKLVFGTFLALSSRFSAASRYLLVSPSSSGASAMSSTISTYFHGAAKKITLTFFQRCFMRGFTLLCERKMSRRSLTLCVEASTHQTTTRRGVRERQVTLFSRDVYTFQLSLSLPKTPLTGCCNTQKYSFFCLFKEKDYLVQHNEAD